MEHEKKVWPEYFDKIASGEKTYEFRLGDWECKSGDLLILREWDPKTERYTGREIKKEVGYVAKEKDLSFFETKDLEKYGYQIISLKDI